MSKMKVVLPVIAQMIVVTGSRPWSLMSIHDIISPGLEAVLSKYKHILDGSKRTRDRNKRTRRIRGRQDEEAQTRPASLTKITGAPSEAPSPDTSGNTPTSLSILGTPTTAGSEQDDDNIPSEKEEEEDDTNSVTAEEVTLPAPTPVAAEAWRKKEIAEIPPPEKSEIRRDPIGENSTSTPVGTQKLHRSLNLPQGFQYDEAAHRRLKRDLKNLKRKEEEAQKHLEKERRGDKLSEEEQKKAHHDWKNDIKKKEDAIHMMNIARVAEANAEVEHREVNTFMEYGRKPSADLRSDSWPPGF